MNQQMATLFRGQWIGVKFYEIYPNRPHEDRPLNVRFCEATRMAALRPILIDEGSVTCPGARYAFGWEPEIPSALIEDCLEKHETDEFAFKELIGKLPRLTKPVQCIGLNTEKKPDLLLSYLLPKDTMKLIKIFNYRFSQCLDMSFCSFMSICGNVAVKTYLEEAITFSFGCDDSRKYAQIKNDRLVVGIPMGLFDIFLDQLTG